MMDLHHDSNVIKDGDFVIISTLIGKKINKLVKVEKNCHVFIKKENISLSELIGDKFGLIYELDKSTRKLINVSIPPEQLRDLFTGGSLVDGIGPDSDNRDNRFIIDDGSAQKLSKNEIEAFKSNGLSSDEIVDNLVKNSLTFKERTVFSQEKYVKKKREKYSNLIRIQKPTIDLLCEMYYSQGPMKIHNLRIDTLSQMLTYCNIRSSRKYLVLDTNIGLITAAVIDRLVGNGSLVFSGYDPGCCIQIYLEDYAVATWRQSVEALNLSQEVLNTCLCSIGIKKLCNISKGLSEPKVVKELKSETIIKPCMDEAKRKKLDSKSKRRLARKIEEEKADELLKIGNLDGLLIISKNYDISNILEILFNFLGPSQPFAIFSNYIEPLLGYYRQLKGRSIHTRLTETWLRNYQILSGRTRPDMNMSGSGGYLLTGIKIIPS